MWSGFDPIPYTREQYAAHVASLPHLPWVRFVVIHNTGLPTLAQWIDGGVSEEQRLINLEHYYEVTEHWHAGPHGFIGPIHICGFSDPLKPGVHASCFNSKTLGFEMVGDYSAEPFDTGPSAAVRDNTIYALAVWHRKLGLRPDVYRYGESGIHPHKACLHDHHDCPGRNVDLAELRQRVLAKMEELGGVPDAPLTPQPAPTRAPSPISAYLRLGSVGPATAALQRGLGLNVVDGKFGPATLAAVIQFQKLHGLIPDGIAGPITLNALGVTQ